MSKAKLVELARIAALLRDAELQKLAEVAKPCQETRILIAALNTVDCGSELDISATQASEKFDQWRFQRRVQLNKALALQTATYLTQHETASRAFGRASVLEKLGKTEA